MKYAARFFQSGSGRVPALEYLQTLRVEERAFILADIKRVEEYGEKAPVSMKKIKGRKGMWEIRTGGYRTLYTVRSGVLWVLHVCKKQDQEHAIELAAKRMKELED